jgi:hypothetical protein
MVWALIGSDRRGVSGLRQIMLVCTDHYVILGLVGGSPLLVQFYGST